MLREDERDRRREQAAMHAALVEGLALAERATPKTLTDYIDRWRKAEWLDATRAAPAPGPPPLNLLTTPYVQAAIRAATGAHGGHAAVGDPTQAAAPTPAEPAEPPAPAPAPTYRLRKARPGGS